MRIIFAFGEKLERERSPRSKMCHPERSEGSPPFNRGGEQTLLELYPKTKTAEILRFAQDDWVGCHPERSEGSPPFNRGGEQTLLELYPKTKTEEMSHFVRHDGVSVVTPRRLCEESPTFNRGGKRNPSKTPL